MFNIIQRRRARIHHMSATPDLMPLIDMVFILLIFFMLTSTVLKPVIQLTLPTARTDDPKPQSPPVIITVNKFGNMYINQDPIQISQLRSSLHPIVSSSHPDDIHIIFSADKSVDYAVFIQVIDELKQLNIHHISLEHDQPG